MPDNPIARWWRARTLARAHARIDPELWPDALAALPLLDGLDDHARQRLTDLAALFLRDKTLELAQGAEIDDRMQLELALQACLPVLELGLHWYRGWHAVILYPNEFVPAREVMYEDGVVGIDDAPKSGEAWQRGPVILSLSDTIAGHERDGYNVVIHELAHKLDMRDGIANGHPTLHRDMSDRGWALDLGAAYADLCRRVDAPRGHPWQADKGSRRSREPRIDAYATESPAEFFAVCSEAFFELPHLLLAEYPAVYAQLRAFYRQDPAARLVPVQLDALG